MPLTPAPGSGRRAPGRRALGHLLGSLCALVLALGCSRTAPESVYPPAPPGAGLPFLPLPDDNELELDEEDEEETGDEAGPADDADADDDEADDSDTDESADSAAADKPGAQADGSKPVPKHRCGRVAAAGAAPKGERCGLKALADE